MLFKPKIPPWLCPFKLLSHCKEVNIKILEVVYNPRNALFFTTISRIGFIEQILPKTMKKKVKIY